MISFDDGALLSFVASPHPRVLTLPARRTGRLCIRHAGRGGAKSEQGTVVPGFGPPHVTLWSIVYELDAQRVHFRTEAASSINTLSLAGIDFSCAAPVLMLDLHAPVDGDVRARLRTYSRDANLALTRETFAQTTFLRGLPDKELERVASWPEQRSCLRPENR